MNKPADYMIYPSLLDAFQTYKTTDSMTQEELLSRLNREGGSTPEMLRGTAFNEVVDLLAEGHCPPVVRNEQTGRNEYQYNYERVMYQFDVEVCNKIASQYEQALRQQYLEADLQTRYGVVRLYGYADGVFMSSIRDIKTTGHYHAQKYLNSWQKCVYTYCARQMGCVVDEFGFDVTDFKSVWTEVYTGEQIDLMNRVGELEEFIAYLNAWKPLIKQPKLFGITNK